MYIYKDNKSSHHEIAYSYISYEECQNNILILEGTREYIRKLEHYCRKIVQIIDDIGRIYQNFSGCDNLPDDKLENLSKRNGIREGIEKVINDFKKAVSKKGTGIIVENEKEMEKNIYKFETEDDDIKEIKSYYEGKIEIMAKKIKVFEILENLYIKQIDNLKNKSNQNKSARKKIKDYNEDFIVYDF